MAKTEKKEPKTNDITVRQLSDKTFDKLVKLRKKNKRSLGAEAAYRLELAESNGLLEESVK